MDFGPTLLVACLLDGPVMLMLKFGFGPFSFCSQMDHTAASLPTLSGTADGSCYQHPVLLATFRCCWTELCSVQALSALGLPLDPDLPSLGSSWPLLLPHTVLYPHNLSISLLLPQGQGGRWPWMETEEPQSEWWCWLTLQKPATEQVAITSGVLSFPLLGSWHHLCPSLLNGECLQSTTWTAVKWHCIWLYAGPNAVHTGAVFPWSVMPKGDCPATGFSAA